jgi:hypothetical protein
MFIVCEHCGRGAEASTVTPRRCAICAPDPETARYLRAIVARRHAEAVGLAAEPTVPAPPGHAWICVNPGGSAHLFAEGESAALCNKIELSYPVVVDEAMPARGTKVCAMCQLVHTRRTVVLATPAASSRPRPARFRVDLPRRPDRRPDRRRGPRISMEVS